jgi:AmmeMemoRadiSam system protein B/AmmeMemoRadiSam system protein A
MENAILAVIRFLDFGNNVYGGNEMKQKFIFYLLFAGLIFVLPVCNRQEVLAGKIRLPARSGQFYPGSKNELSDMIMKYLENSKKVDCRENIVALLAPHAGYVYSGQVAANAYRQVQGLDFDAVIIIGSSHTMHFKGASIGDWTAYKTPLGNAAIDIKLANQLKSATSLISSIPVAHQNEHSVEVHIPFIQIVLPQTPIVPMIVGQLSYNQCKTIAKAIASSSKGRRILLIASSDMSHYPAYNDAVTVDTKMLDVIKEYKPQNILQANNKLLSQNIPELSCTLCGMYALITVMLAANELGSNNITLLPYSNSGDISGMKEKVVGYGAVVFSHDEAKKTERGGILNDINFSREEKRQLFRIARESILAALKKETPPVFKITESNLQLKRGVFITLTNRGKLRGCIGNFAQDFPVYEIVSKMAVAASTQDYRFMYNPVTIQEMEEIEIKISILSELKKISSVEEIEVGKHGIWITQGSRSGTYLPEVATEMDWSKTEFLSHCCAEKAGLAPDAWKKDADIFIYTSQILDEKKL